MIRYLSLLFFLFSAISMAQEDEEVHSIFFDFNRFNLKKVQADSVVSFVNKIDTSRIESIQIFGYCDDRGKDAYNFTLSTNRANTVKDKLIEKGIKSKIIITLEGKGRIMLDEDMQTNIPEARSKNRRVDVIVNFRTIVVEDLKIPGVYSTINKDRVVGDRIYLDRVLFERGSSQLTYKAKKELDRIALELHKFKNIHFKPKPVQKPHPPIWIGGESKAALRRTARLGNGWFPAANNPKFRIDSPDSLKDRLDTLRQLCDEEKRDFGKIIRRVAEHTAIDKKYLCA